MDKLRELATHELDKIIDAGLTTSNLERAWRLTDIVKDIADTEYKDVKRAYYEASTVSMKGEEAYNRYMNSKKDYRYAHSGESKTRLMETLEEYMENVLEKMEDMLRDAECMDEKQTIQRYISKLQTLR